jgi:hypothetical protein
MRERITHVVATGISPGRRSRAPPRPPGVALSRVVVGAAVIEIVIVIVIVTVTAAATGPNAGRFLEDLLKRFREQMLTESVHVVGEQDVAVFFAIIVNEVLHLLDSYVIWCHGRTQVQHLLKRDLRSHMRVVHQQPHDRLLDGVGQAPRKALG